MTGPGHKPAKLAVFDVDGTLTRTYDDDIEAFTGAVRQAFGFEGVSDDWSGYRHVTDSGILDELLRDRLGRAATPADLSAAEAVPGAPAFVRRLLAEGEWAVAAATGAWRTPAELRLREADIPIDPACIATSSEHMARRDIVELAIARAAVHWGLAEGPDGFARVVLLGDGPWDVKTAGALGFPFIGVGQGAAAARLEAAGAGCIAADFTDGDRLLRLLETAIVPTL